MNLSVSRELQQSKFSNEQSGLRGSYGLRGLQGLCSAFWHDRGCMDAGESRLYDLK